MNAEQFNALYSVGTPVFAYPGFRPEDASDARRLVTRTRTKAQVSASGVPVVWVEGEGSYICLTHVDPVSEDVWGEARAAEKPAEPEKTPTGEDERIQGLLYEAITTFQRTAHLSSLQHAQMRGYLAEHLAPTLLAELAAVRAERDAFRDQRNNVFATNEQVHAKVTEAFEARLRAENETRTARREATDLHARIAELEKAAEEIRFLHKDSPMGPCPVCVDADAWARGDDPTVPYPCPTARLAGAKDCDPPSHRTARES